MLFLKTKNPIYLCYELFAEYMIKRNVFVCNSIVNQLNSCKCMNKLTRVPGWLLVNIAANELYDLLRQHKRENKMKNKQKKRKIIGVSFVVSEQNLHFLSCYHWFTVVTILLADNYLEEILLVNILVQKLMVKNHNCVTFGNKTDLEFENGGWL